MTIQQIGIAQATYYYVQSPLGTLPTVASVRNQGTKTRPFPWECQADTETGMLKILATS